MNIDVCMHKFRLASRELFNHYFHGVEPNPGAQHEIPTSESFSEVEKALFRGLVIQPLNIDDVVYGILQPNISVKMRTVKFMPIMLNRELTSGYWDHPLTEVTNEVGMLFVSFFDWDHLGWRDNQYVRVQVSRWDEYPELVGKHGLIEARDVEFVVVPVSRA